MDGHNDASSRSNISLINTIMRSGQTESCNSAAEMQCLQQTALEQRSRDIGKDPRLGDFRGKALLHEYYSYPPFSTTTHH